MPSLPSSGSFRFVLVESPEENLNSLWTVSDTEPVGCGKHLASELLVQFLPSYLMYTLTTLSYLPPFS